ncbi:MAG TPA: glycogen debranching N-terminal domain-containing protein [Burkholderiales bacterium]|nr:glycogen debranching N-terminal domain-containing protein [Burkholderiales bacterium]
MATILHSGGTFVVADPSGDISPGTEHGYYHLDTRFLDRLELRLDGRKPVQQSASTPRWEEGFHFLTNPSLEGAQRQTLQICVHRIVSDGLHQDIEVENFGDGPAHLRLEVGLGADFAYILTVKHRANTGSSDWHPRISRERQGDRAVLFRLDGAEIRHEALVTFDRPIDAFDDGVAAFQLDLERRGRFRLCIGVVTRLADGEAAPEHRCGDPRPPGRKGQRNQRRRQFADASCSLETDHPVLQRAFDRARDDLASLRIKSEEQADGGNSSSFAIAAGIPWYMDLFGRDSLIASYQTMFVNPALARGTLTALARLQGTKVDPVSEEAPGKILHEYRRGPITAAARKLIPTYPYYGTIDATPLFLITLSEYVRWIGDLGFARQLWKNVEAAVQWMFHYGDRDGDGLLEYALDSKHGLDNQGWKDSRDSIRFRDGTLAKPSIALVEVQGYACEAMRRVAELSEHLGHDGRGLREKADRLRADILSRYWMENRGYFAEALDGQKHRVDSLTSNPGHLLWCRVPDEDRAASTARVLLSDELFSGFGIRTMGSREGGYNPLSYHNGSVWPHDSSLALAGLVACGQRERAAQLASGILHALSLFPDAQPPEVFCGYSPERYPEPVSYPNSNKPQAWASGAVMLLLRSLLGLEVNALREEIVVRPLAIDGLRELVLSGVPVADKRVRIAVSWKDGRPRVRVEGAPGGWFAPD